MLLSPDVSLTISASQAHTLLQLMPDGHYIARRFLPLEEERLMGFPDGHTDLTGCDVDGVTDAVSRALGYDVGKTETLRSNVVKWSRSCPKTKRFKAIGNSMVVPVMRWIGERLLMVDGVLERM